MDKNTKLFEALKAEAEIGYVVESLHVLAEGFIKSKGLMKEFIEFCSSKEILQKTLLEPLEGFVKDIRNDIKTKKEE